MKRIRVISLIFVMGIAVTILLFSSQNGDKSGVSSGQFTEIILDVMGEEEAAEERMLEIGFLIRKLAHFSEYFALATSIYIFVWTYGISLAETTLLSVLCATAYAATDELHQYFVPGRNASALDILLDSMGSVAGVLAIRLFFFWVEKMTNVKDS